MENIISAIEQEWKFTIDSEGGSQQYRKGYTRALGIVAEFLSLQEGECSPSRNPSCSAVERLIVSLSLEKACLMFGRQDSSQDEVALTVKRHCNLTS